MEQKKELSNDKTKRRICDVIYDELKEKILSSEIKPGDKFPSERKLMEITGYSRASIREAMKMLAREGYIETFSRSSGAVVQELNGKAAVQSLEDMLQVKKLSIEEIIEFRMLTESDSARLAADRRTEEDLQRMECLLEKMEDPGCSVDEFIRYDYEFHTAVAAASKNQMYAIMLTVCRNAIGDALRKQLEEGEADTIRKRYLDIREKHRKICRAIRRQEDVPAAFAMKEHLQDAGKSY
ncbi:MAG: FadR family transcriptional regulator [Eubacterium sp.]|nr:FadR family transcriptional regulator [Eubacterium sp.]